MTPWKSGKAAIPWWMATTVSNTAEKKGFPFTVEEKEFANEEKVKVYIISAQLGLKNLSPVGESYLRGKSYLATRKQGARDVLTSGQKDKEPMPEPSGAEFMVAKKPYAGMDPLPRRLMRSLRIATWMQKTSSCHVGPGCLAVGFYVLARLLAIVVSGATISSCTTFSRT